MIDPIFYLNIGELRRFAKEHNIDINIYKQVRGKDKKVNLVKTGEIYRKEIIIGKIQKFLSGRRKII